MKFFVYLSLFLLSTLCERNVYSMQRFGEKTGTEGILKQTTQLSLALLPVCNKEPWHVPTIKGDEDICNISNISDIEHFKRIAPYIWTAAQEKIDEIPLFIQYCLQGNFLNININELKIHLGIVVEEYVTREVELHQTLRQREIENLLIAINMAMGQKYAHCFTVRSTKKLEEDKAIEDAENLKIKMGLESRLSFWKYACGASTVGMFLLFGYIIGRA